MIRNGGRDLEEAAYCLMKRAEEEWKLCALMIKMGAIRQDCEDVIDDALMGFITAVNKGRFDESRSIGAYIYGMTRNLFLKRRGKDLRDLRGDHLQLFFENMEQETVEQQLIREERKKWLMALLGHLKEKCRSILVLAFLEEKSNSEIAAIRGYKSKEVVAVKKRECLKRLMDLID
ncbi:MAG: sigma-70 family RNA polymerase sigma factor [Saprospiraceae bacterium]|nr:sigma-70 family RNA polymerase sigma factor [Saprospiraceae bacterium]